MAKKPAASESVKPSEARESITEKKLKALLKDAHNSTKDVASLTGEMREKIGYAKQHDHLHTGAFALIRRLDRMEPEKLAEFMDCFDHYYDISGLEDRAKQVVSMSFGPGKDKDADDGDADATDGKGKVTKDPKLSRAFPAPASAGRD